MSTDAAAHDPAWPQAITPHYGTAVQDEKRFPRSVLEAEFDSVLTRSNGGLLFGLRRIGKSSEAIACAQRLRQRTYQVIEEDAQGKTSEAALLCAILGKMQTHGFGARILSTILNDNAVATAAREALKLLNETTGDIQIYFAPIAAAIKRAIQATDNIVLMIDELPWLCRSILQADPQTGRRRVDVLLAALRDWRVAGMRMLLLGSIGLVGLSREYRLDLNHLNDLTPLSVPPLDPDEAIAFVQALAAGGRIQGWTPAHTTTLLEESAAFYPAILQRGFEKVTVGGRAATLERFPDIFAISVRPDLDAAFFQQFDSRMRGYRTLDAPLSPLLPQVLRIVLVSPNAVTRAELHNAVGTECDEADLSDALGILREDGFLVPRIERDGSQNWRAASTLVTMWWRQRHGGGHA